MPKKSRMTSTIKAVTKFTDREEPRKVFWDNYNEFKQTMDQENIKVIMYYGIGGIGKSKLLEQLQIEINDKISNGYYVSLDLSNVHYGINAIIKLQKFLKFKYHFKFPLFGAALSQRAKIQSNGEDIAKEKLEMLLGETADDAFDILSWFDKFPGVDYIPKVYRLVKKAKNFVVKEIDEVKLKEEINEIKAINSVKEIDGILPELFGKDIKNNMMGKKEPLVVFIDNYESLVNELIDSGCSYAKDDWLKGEDGLIIKSTNILWVIAGRERLKWSDEDEEWEGSLEQHLIEKLSESDASDFLATNQIPETLHHALYEKTKGVPLLLDLTVDTYNRIKERGDEPTVDRFGGDNKTIVEHYIKYMDAAQKEIMYKMAFLRKWPENNEEVLLSGTNITYIQLDALLKSSCIKNIDGMNIFHEVVGAILRRNCSSTVKDHICKDLFAYFNEKIAHVMDGEEDASFIIVGAALTAGEIYSSDKFDEFFEEKLLPRIFNIKDAYNSSILDICENINLLLKEKYEYNNSVVTFLFLYGEVLIFWGYDSQAVEIYEILKDKLLKEKGEDNSDTLKAMGNLSYCYREIGRTQDAIGLEERVLEQRKRIFGEDHPDTLIAMGNLAISYAIIGRMQEAIDLKERVLEQRKRILGEDHPDTLDAMVSLSNSYAEIGRMQEAIDLKERVLEQRKRILGENHPDTLEVMGNLACSYSKIGRIEEAIELGERVVAQSKQILGENHPGTLGAMENLASFYSVIGRMQKAIEMEERVLAQFKRISGEGHPKTLVAMGNLAISYANIGRLQEAIGLEERVLEQRKRILGEDHPDTLKAMVSLSNSYAEIGRLQEAIGLEERVLEQRKRILGEDHPDTLKAMGYLANSYRGIGRVQDAIGLEERVLEQHRRILGEDHPDTLIAMVNLSNSYADIGRTQDAIGLEERVLEQHKRILGEDHPNTLSVMLNLAVSYLEIGRIEEAIVLGERVVEQHKRILGDSHPNTLKAMGNLALSYSKIGRIEEAIELGECVVAQFKRILGEGHPDTLHAMAILAGFYAKIGREH